MGITWIIFESILVMSSKTGLWASIGLHSLWNTFLISIISITSVAQKLYLTNIHQFLYILVDKWIVHW